MKLSTITTAPLRCSAFAVRAALPALLLLAGCGTTIVSSRDPSNADPDQWRTAAPSLPVELHGTVPGDAETALASLFPPAPDLQYASLGPIALPDLGKRIVLYVNPAQLPAASELCGQSDQFRPGEQTGRFANVTAALCDGPAVISSVQGYALTSQQTAEGLRRSLGVIQAGLFDALEPGATDPDQYNH
jgi:hypothetical protein